MGPKRLPVLILVSILCVAGQSSVTWAIDIYHFLVEYKNGRVVERIFPDSPQSYRASFKGYVSRTKLIEKRHYSVDGFIRTFGEKNHERLMAGYFGFGLEEEIIFNRQTQGLAIDAEALPPPDKTSAKLLETWKFLDNGTDQASGEKINPLANRFETSQNDAPNDDKGVRDRAPESAVVKEKPEKRASVSAPSPKNPGNAPLKGKAAPQESSHSRSPSPVPAGEKITVYRFLAEYINGKIAEKCTAMPPEKYQKKYRGYVTKTAFVDKKTYSKGSFEEAFGRHAYLLLIQGNFGVSDIEMIMQSRIQRGMPPRKNVLPDPGPENPKLRKKLESLQKTRNFTLTGPG